MSKELIPQDILESKIFIARGHRIMLDRDLALLYGIEVKRLNEQVKRKIKRFPSDFMFQLSNKDAAELSRSQIATLKRGQNIKYLPYAFTENGISMLSSVLNTDRAIGVNIQIMRTFNKLRRFLFDNAELRRKLEALERNYDAQFKSVFNAIKALMQPQDDTTATPKKITGFHP
ncbi:MAG: ORF6N domain-containing protein [Elusimicrobiota bacterium]|nr:ORF6N domain-containing protein [Elusimicrobiota bacterium]